VRGKVATPQPEAASAVFPLNLTHPTFRLGQIGSVIDPNRQIAPGANHVLWCVDNWLDAGDDRRGMGIIPLDAPLFSIGSLGIYEYPITRALETPLVYGHLFNTQWGTNFPQWHEGDFTFRYRLWPHAGDWRTGRLWQHAWETTRPALAWPALEAAPPAAGLAGSEGLVVLAVKPRRDAPGWLVRVWDALGLARTASITLRAAATEVRRCDLLEYPTEPLPSRVDGEQTTIPLAIAPHGVETLALAFA
jgi:alpha-mannosidase